MKEVRSYSREGNSTVVEEFYLSVDPVSALQDVRDKVSALHGKFRREISTQNVSQVDPHDHPILTLVLTSGQVPHRELTTWVEKILKQRLQMVAGVGDVKLIGGLQREISVDVDPTRLESSGLSLHEMVKALPIANQDVPVGSVSSGSRNMVVRLEGKLKSPEDFEQLSVAYRNGVPIRREDIATVADTEAEQSSVSVINGRPGISLDLRAVHGANLVKVVTEVKARVEELKSLMPSGVQVHASYDGAKDVRASLSNVESTILEGSGLTVLIVFLFLGSWRSTVITGLTIPLSLIGTLFAIHMFGFTLNMLALLALALSIGLLIDDAIVVRENIVRQVALGKRHDQAVLDGTNEIEIAVVATTLTVVAVFLPVGVMGGIIGRFFHQFGLTVAIAALISMLVSLTLEPMLSSIWNDPVPHDGKNYGLLKRFLNTLESSFKRISENHVSMICWALGNRKAVLGIALLLTLTSSALVPLIGGRVHPRAR